MKVPGKARREGISLPELAEMFPDEDAARKWWEGIVWPQGRHCPRCGSTRTHEASHAKCPYRCTDCRSYFSAKTGTVIEGSKLPFRTWAFAIHLETTSLKGVSSMKLHRDLGISQKSAWFMLHRIREVWRDDAAARLAARSRPTRPLSGQAQEHAEVQAEGARRPRRGRQGRRQRGLTT